MCKFSLYKIFLQVCIELSKEISKLENRLYRIGFNIKADKNCFFAAALFYLKVLWNVCSVDLEEFVYLYFKNVKIILCCPKLRSSTCKFSKNKDVNILIKSYEEIQKGIRRPTKTGWLFRTGPPRTIVAGGRNVLVKICLNGTVCLLRVLPPTAVNSCEHVFSKIAR